jgi:hypothetical protein
VTGVNLETTLERHRGFWDRTAGPFVSVSKYSPLAPLRLPLSDSTLAEGKVYLTPEMLSVDDILDIEESPPRPRLQPDQEGGINEDVFIVRPPWSRMCWLEAIMGCPVAAHVDAGSIYSEPYLNGPQEIDKIPEPRDNGWMDLLVEYAFALADNANCRYYVSHPLMRGSIDLVAALIGYDSLSFGLFDRPTEIRKLAELSTEVFMMVADALDAAVPATAGGRVSRFNMYAPGTVSITQCDASAAVSPRHYEEFFFPYDELTCKHFNYSIIHLHSEYLHTIDTFLKGDYPTAIQVSLDTEATSKTVSDLMPIFKRILGSKPLFVTGSCTKEELDELLDALPHLGLCVVAQLQTNQA